MRKGMLVIGIFSLFLGLILISTSRMIVESNKWSLVDYATAPGMGVRKLSVQGNLKAGDVFLVNFTIRPPQGPIPDVAGVNITITDPNNNKTIYDVEIGPGPQFLNPFPTGVVNVTGPYKVDADARIVNLTRLDLRINLVEKTYPFFSLSIVGGAIFGSGVVVSIVALKTSKRKRRIPRE
jgi:hypothetical protein